MKRQNEVHRLLPPEFFDGGRQDLEILAGGVKGDGAFGADEVNPRGQFFIYILDDIPRRAVSDQGDITRPPHQRHLFARKFPRLRRGNFGIEMETFDSGRPDGCQAVRGIAADVKDQGTGDPFMQFMMNFGQKIPIDLRGTEIPRAMVPKGDGIGPAIDLGVGERDGDLDQLPQEVFDAVRFQESGRQEFLDPENMIAQGPGAKDFSHDGHFLSEVFL